MSGSQVRKKNDRQTPGLNADLEVTHDGQVTSSNFRIGVRLRHARMLRGMRLKDVSEKAQCSESMLSKIENDRAVPSLTALHRLCQALNLSISDLMDGGPPKRWTIMRPEDRAKIGFTDGPDVDKDTQGTQAEVLVPHADGRLLEGFVVSILPGGSSGGSLQHAGEEVGYVLEGTLVLNIEGDINVLNAGDSFHFASDLKHSYSNPGTVLMRAIWINTPPTF